MLLSISKTFEFSASHAIEGLPTTHKCSRLHGHSYRVRIECEGTPDEVGFVIDYGELGWVSGFIDKTLDHHHLNDVLPVNPTAENIAVWLWDQIAEWLRGRPEIKRIHGLTVAVSESRSTWATLRSPLTEA
ncbi:6-pyruvoyl tetrahydropterin synthase family protein [Nocardiopsis flavescens]|uniref:6-pyruvoyl trahydropterin synthase family protein n=1 Tax=Nocardiopsis flavescens TaxID=758803 RepID=UPI00364E40B5